MRSIKLSYSPILGFKQAIFIVFWYCYSIKISLLSLLRVPSQVKMFYNSSQNNQSSRWQRPKLVWFLFYIIKLSAEACVARHLTSQTPDVQVQGSSFARHIVSLD